MANRYWEASIAADAVLDWVSKEVEEAVMSYWEGGTPTSFIEERGGKLVLTVVGPDKPDDGSGISDVYELNFDVLENLTDWSRINTLGGAPGGDVMKNQALALRRLAKEIGALAEYAESFN